MREILRINTLTFMEEQMKTKTRARNNESMSMEIGREAFERGDGDLFYALRGSRLQAEIMLAWLDRELRKPGADPLALVSMGGHTLDDAEAAVNRGETLGLNHDD